MNATPRRRIALVLLHHPVLDRQGEVVTTAITNLDLHDISRSALTYGAEAFYVAHPIAAQRELASRVREHWVTGSGKKRIPDRQPALERLCIVESLDEAVANFAGSSEGSPVLWTTSAVDSPSCLSFGQARSELASEGPDVLLCFGTGWGLAPEVVARAAAKLEPVRSAARGAYNHLSVRAAAAIILDRLLGPER